MKDNQGLIIAALVAIVAVVGLVILFNAKGTTGEAALACEQVVDPTTGVGSFLCRSAYVGPQFEPSYLNKPRQFELYDQFNWDGK